MILLNGIKVREWIIPIIKKEIVAIQLVFMGQKSCWTIFIMQTFKYIEKLKELHSEHPYS